MRALSLVSVLLLALGGVARAEDDETEARFHFRAGEALFRVGKYNEAIREFQAGYGLAPRAPFLLNIAQAYRRLGDVQNAIDAYQKFLDLAAADDPRRADVESVLAELRAGRAPPPAVEVAPLRAPAAQPIAPSPPPPVAIVAPTPPSPKPRPRRTLAIALGTVAGLLVIGGVAAGLVVGLSQPRPPSSDLGNFQPYR